MFFLLYINLNFDTKRLDRGTLEDAQSQALIYILAMSTYCLHYCSVETITLGDKRIGIRTSLLEEKATACNMLCCYADELKEGFFPWIDQVISLFQPLPLSPRVLFS